MTTIPTSPDPSDAFDMGLLAYQRWERIEQLEALLKRTGLHVEDHDGVTLWCFKGGAASVRLDGDEAALLRSLHPHPPA